MALAYQQRLCEQLNEIVTAHSQELLGLKRLVAELQGRIKELANNARTAIPNRTTRSRRIINALLKIPFSA